MAITEQDIELILQRQALEELDLQQLTDDGVLDLEEADADVEIRSVQTFAEASLLSSNRGVVLRLSDGSEFQITVVRSR